MSASLVGSEMCIRDRFAAICGALASSYVYSSGRLRQFAAVCGSLRRFAACLLYTSDAADDM
eukprot:7060778-Alexandrium_andersonii.AAC.1